MTTPAFDAPPLAWMDDAACSGMDAAIFVTERGTITPQAREACRRCPVKKPCLEYALDNEIKHGTFGGKSEHDRVLIAVRRQLIAEPDVYACICQMCGVEFAAPNPRSAVCSDECRRARHRHWQRNYLARKASA